MKILSNNLHKATKRFQAPVSLTLAAQKFYISFYSVALFELSFSILFFLMTTTMMMMFFGWLLTVATVHYNIIHIQTLLSGKNVNPFVFHYIYFINQQIFFLMSSVYLKMLNPLAVAIFHVSARSCKAILHYA